MKTLKEGFGLRLKELRKRRKITQEQLAEAVGLNQRQLTRIESGENFPSCETLERLCVAIDVHPQILFEYDWEYRLIYERTGTENRPLVRVIEKGGKASVKSSSVEVMREFKEIKQFHLKDTDKSMVQTARKLNKPINVEHFGDNGRKYIKAYYPDGSTEILFTEDEVICSNLRHKINDRMKKLGKNHLNYINMAIDAAEDKESMNKFKELLLGIELKLT